MNQQIIHKQPNYMNLQKFINTQINMNLPKVHEHPK